MLYLLGITGSIGCGKSTVTRLLGARGAITIDADQLAKEALAPGSPLLIRVAERFGNDLLEGTPECPQLNRTRLAERIFPDPAAKTALEELIHPFVFRNMATRLDALSRSRAAEKRTIVALEIPLLFETQTETLCDATLVVACGGEQEKRLEVNRPALTPTLRRQIIAQQLPETIKQQRATWSIDNRIDQEQLPKEIDRFWQTLCDQSDPASPAWPKQWHPFLHIAMDIF